MCSIHGIGSVWLFDCGFRDRNLLGTYNHPCRDSCDSRDLRGPTVDRQVSVATTALEPMQHGEISFIIEIY